jgi:uncharacterized membrane protein (UPF0127 family)
MRHSASRRKIVIGAVLMILGLALTACANDPRVLIEAPDGKRLANVKVEIADTPSERELGLMYRQHLDENTGMIFIFPSASHLSFWMKNTEIPLDMIFADAKGKIVGIVENATPFSEESLGVDGDSLYVLETNGGFAKRHHLHAGDNLKFVGFTPHALQ